MDVYECKSKKEVVFDYLTKLGVQLFDKGLYSTIWQGCVFDYLTKRGVRLFDKGLYSTIWQGGVLDHLKEKGVSDFLRMEMGKYVLCSTIWEESVFVC